MPEPNTQIWPKIELWFRSKYSMGTKRLHSINMAYVREWLLLNGYPGLAGAKYAQIMHYQPNWQNLRQIYIKQLESRQNAKKGLFCEVCGKDAYQIKGWDGWEFDHIKPLKAGGLEFDIANIRLVCKPCNDDNSPKRYKMRNLKGIV